MAGNDLSGGNVVTRREGGREATNVWYHLFNLARLLEVTLLEPDVAWRANLQEAVDHTVALAARTLGGRGYLEESDRGEEIHGTAESVC